MMLRHLVETAMSFTLVKRNVAYVIVKKIISKHSKGSLNLHAVKTGHNIKWNHFPVLANGSSDLHCKIKETLLIKVKGKPALNKNFGSEKLWLYSTVSFHCYLFTLLFLSYSL